MNTLQKFVCPPAMRFAPSPILPELDQLMPDRLRLRDALRVKSAELWLRLDLPELASRELEALPAHLDAHPSVLRMQMLVWSALSLR